MLVFNEGLPRSGKSYDAVLNHVLVALKRKRHVFARLNGMDEDSCRQAMADRLKLPRDHVEEYLHHVPTAEVLETFVAEQTDVKWIIDAKFKNALVIIDEVHEFFVGGTREQLQPRHEQFVALHGHYGMDILVMSQHYKRVHTAVRYRVERKNVFQKMTALGKVGETRYQQAYFQATAPDRFEKVNTETHSYDTSVFPCYHGIVPATDEDGEVTQQVYDAGKTNVWKALVLPAVIVIPLAIFGVYYMLNFFLGGGGNELVKTKKSEQTFTVAAPASSGAPVFVDGIQGVAPDAPGRVAAVVKKPDPKDSMEPGQAYVWGLGEKARARLAAVIGDGDSARGLVEWVTPDGNPVDRLSFAQLRALGIVVSLEKFGVRLTAGDQVSIVTAWPLNVPLRDVQPRLYDTSQSRGVSIGASEASPDETSAPGVTTEPSSIADYGQFRTEKRG